MRLVVATLLRAAMNQYDSAADGRVGAHGAPTNGASHACCGVERRIDK